MENQTIQSHGQPAANETLLATLKTIQRAQETRRALMVELDAALATYLSDELPFKKAVMPATDDRDTSVCAMEAIRPPNEEELKEILRIALLGLMEVKTEVALLKEKLRSMWNRADLATSVKKVEDLEFERLQETLQRDQLRRLAFLEPQKDFHTAIAKAVARRNVLSQAISEEGREIAAEIADLTAAEGSTDCS